MNRLLVLSLAALVWLAASTAPANMLSAAMAAPSESEEAPQSEETCESEALTFARREDSFRLPAGARALLKLWQAPPPAGLAHPDESTRFPSGHRLQNGLLAPLLM
ncbi:MAG: hypothetical protein KDA75_02430 [Planctomycetaceae bacterium]|nr:hypothetical protein [Planctomycetaceae bacterium]